jgi:adenylate cyclase
MSGRVLAAMLLGLGCGVLGIAATLFRPVLELEESVGLQALFNFRGAVPAGDDVVVIGLGRDSAEALGLPADLTILPRSLHAALLRRLSAAGASVVAFDILFDQPRDDGNDPDLARAIADAGNVVLLDRMQRRVSAPETGAGEGLIREQRSRPIVAFREVAAASAPFPLPVVPVRTSQFWVFLPTAADAPTLPIAALQQHALDALDPFVALIGELRPSIRGRLRARESMAALPPGMAIEITMQDLRQMFRNDAELGPDILARLNHDPDLARKPELARRLRALALIYGGPDSRYVNYYGPPRSIRTVPYEATVAGLPGNPSQWRGKAVFVGFSERTQPDQQDTFYSAFSQRSGLNLSGVEIAATAFANLLDGRPVTPLPIGRSLWLLLAWGALLGAALAQLSTGPAVAAMLAASVAYGGVAVQQFAASGLWLPLFVPLAVQLPVALIGGIWLNYRRAHSRGARFRRATSQYLPAAVVRQLDDDGDAATGHYQLVQGLCLVTDADQYTALSESMRPEQLATLLNAYYEILFRIVQEHGGQVTDVVGDSMVSVWIADAEPGALNAAACRAALEIAATDSQQLADGRTSLPTRVGVHAGELLLGTIGARQHMEYRAVGDTVNSASRVQALNKQLGTRVLVTGDSLPAASDLLSRRLGRFLLAGKQEPLGIFELIAPASAAMPATSARLAMFSLALEIYESGKIVDALDAFSSLTAQYPDDGPGRFFVELCRRLLEAPPEGEWDPVVRVRRK